MTTTPKPLSREREQEIRETHPGDWYSGEWTHDHVEADGDEAAYCRVVHSESGEVLATLPDFAGPIALFICDAHDAVPELLADNEWLQARVTDLEALQLQMGRETETLAENLGQSEEDLAGANLSLWEEEQDTARLRVAARIARQRAARLRTELAHTARSERNQMLARVAELEAAQREIRSIHTDSPMGPCPVCIDADALAAGGDGLVSYPCPTARAAGARDADPPNLGGVLAALAENTQSTAAAGGAR